MVDAQETPSDTVPGFIKYNDNKKLEVEHVYRYFGYRYSNSGKRLLDNSHLVQANLSRTVKSLKDITIRKI